MKNVQLGISLILITTIILFSAGCKKKTEEKVFLLTSMDDSANAIQVNYTYDASGKMIKAERGTDRFDFYYDGDKLLARNFTNSGTLETMDSFKYDGDQIEKIQEYEASFGVLVKTTTFGYNGDKTLNSATVDNVSALTPDVMYDYTYTAGRLNKRTTSVKTVSTYEKKTEIEFLGYDDKKNPFETIYNKYMIDQFDSYPFQWAFPNNFTSGKMTEFDTNTGNVINVVSASPTYLYNSDGLPSKHTSDIGVFNFTYQEL